MSDAVEDIVFLANRLKGIIEVSDTLSTRSNLENQVKELEKSVEEQKEHVQRYSNLLRETNENLTKVTEVIEVEKNKAKEDCAYILKEAKDEAAKIIDAANASYEAKLSEANIALEQVKQEIKAKNEELYTMAAEVDAHSTKLKTAKSELSKLKEKL